MICSKDISSIKMELNKNIGQKIILKGTLGRNKAFEKEKRKSRRRRKRWNKKRRRKTYPSIFKVKYKEVEPNITYKYTDILTNELQISIFDGKEYNPLIPVLSKTKF